MVVPFVRTIEDLCAGRDANNAAVSNLSSLLMPEELFHMSLANLLALVKMQRPPLKLIWNNKPISNIEEDFCLFPRSFRLGEIPFESENAKFGSGGH